jgi:hypothetical protein
MPDLHKMPVFEGMSVRDAWQHISDAGIGNAVPEFAREAALGRRHVWVNAMVNRTDNYVAGAWFLDGREIPTDMLDEPVVLSDPEADDG